MQNSASGAIQAEGLRAPESNIKSISQSKDVQSLPAFNIPSANYNSWEQNNAPEYASTWHPWKRHNHSSMFCIRNCARSKAHVTLPGIWCKCRRIRCLYWKDFMKEISWGRIRFGQKLYYTCDYMKDGFALVMTTYAIQCQLLGTEPDKTSKAHYKLLHDYISMQTVYLLSFNLSIIQPMEFQARRSMCVRPAQLLQFHITQRHWCVSLNQRWTNISWNSVHLEPNHSGQ